MFGKDFCQKLAQTAILSSAFSASMGALFSDPEEEATRLAEILGGFPFFAGSVVFIDGFWDFTVPQENLIQRIAGQAENIFVSFAADPQKNDLFSLPLRSAGRILRAAKEISVAVEDIFLPAPEEKTAIGFLKENLKYFENPPCIFSGNVVY